MLGYPRLLLIGFQEEYRHPANIRMSDFTDLTTLITQIKKDYIDENNLCNRLNKSV